MIDIRPYRLDDELEVIQLWNKVFPEIPLHNDPLRDIQSKLKIQPGLFLVAVNDHLLAGTAMAGMMDTAAGFIILPLTRLIAEKALALH